jgi:hypothetical protein
MKRTLTLIAIYFGLLLSLIIVPLAGHAQEAISNPVIAQLLQH